MTAAIDSANSFAPLGTSLDGMRRGFARMNAGAARLAAGDLDPRHVVDQIAGKVTFEASAKVLQTADEMLGVLLDEKA